MLYVFTQYKQHDVNANNRKQNNPLTLLTVGDIVALVALNKHIKVIFYSVFVNIFCWKHFCIRSELTNNRWMLSNLDLSLWWKFQWFQQRNPAGTVYPMGYVFFSSCRSYRDISLIVTFVKAHHSNAYRLFVNYSSHGYLSKMNSLCHVIPFLAHVTITQLYTHYFLY